MSGNGNIENFGKNEDMLGEKIASHIVITLIHSTEMSINELLNVFLF